MWQDETLVLKATPCEGNETHFDIELDDGIIDGVSEEYNRILDEKKKKKIIFSIRL